MPAPGGARSPRTAEPGLAGRFAGGRGDCSTSVSIRSTRALREDRRVGGPSTTAGVARRTARTPAVADPREEPPRRGGRSREKQPRTAGPDLVVERGVARRGPSGRASTATTRAAARRAPREAGRRVFAPREEHARSGESTGKPSEDASPEPAATTSTRESVALEEPPPSPVPRRRSARGRAAARNISAARVGNMRSTAIGS